MSTILVVDDNSYFMGFLADGLSPLGHKMLYSLDGEMALKIAAKEIPDLILLDIEMPGMDGFTVLDKLNEDLGLKDIPVLFLSGNGETVNKVRGLESGAVDFIAKPVDMNELRARVNTHLGLKKARDKSAQIIGGLKSEKEKSDHLLKTVFPSNVVTEMKMTAEVKPKKFENIAVLMTDVGGYTDFSAKHDTDEVLMNIQEMVRSFEKIVGIYGLEQINAFADSFTATSGLSGRIENPVLCAVNCGLELILATQKLASHWEIRVGIDFGRVIAGVVGAERSLFSLYGDTMNTAARMESLSKPGVVCVSASAWNQVSEYCVGRSQGMFEVKGKGGMEIFYVYKVRDFDPFEQTHFSWK